MAHDQASALSLQLGDAHPELDSLPSLQSRALSLALSSGVHCVVTDESVDRSSIRVLDRSSIRNLDRSSIRNLDNRDNVAEL